MSFRSSQTAPYARFRHIHWVLLGVALIGLGAVLGLRSGDARAVRSSNLSAQGEITLPLELPPLPLPAEATTAGSANTHQAGPRREPAGDWHELEVRRGDNLSTLFARAGLGATEVYAVLAAGADTQTLQRLYPGEKLRARVDEGRLQELIYEQDALRALHVIRTGDQLRAQRIERPVERRLAHSTATIDSSLFVAGQAAGLSDKLIMELAGIFGWDIDFVLDIRAGDRFSVIYEELYREGEKLRDGHILAAEFVNQGRVYRAVRYGKEGGSTDFYDPKGMSMRKAFLRTPVDFTRISSRFNLRRKHPVLNRIRAHRGVDYAAASGTPVKATGDGKVVFRGVKGGYGKTIVLQHGTRYSTLYAHLSRYARGVRAGRRVRQGQVIAYVGQTGLATGPHLHYEFRIDGVHRNPLTVKFPDAIPIAPRYKQDFLNTAKPLLAQLDTLNRATVALRQP